MGHNLFKEGLPPLRPQKCFLFATEVHKH